MAERIDDLMPCHRCGAHRWDVDDEADRVRCRECNLDCARREMRYAVTIGRD